MKLRVIDDGEFSSSKVHIDLANFSGTYVGLMSTLLFLRLSL